MRTAMVVLAAMVLLPGEAMADRFKSSGGGGSISFGTQNRFLAPSPYSNGGSAKTAFTFTTSPLWALVGLAKVKGELRVASRLSIAIQAAGGYSVPHEKPTVGLGAQASVYLTGNFDRGWALGVNTMQFGTMLDPQAALQTPWDRFDGAYLGWKSTAANRNVLEVQIGAQQWMRNQGSPNGAADPLIVPTLGLNYGWAW